MKGVFIYLIIFLFIYLFMACLMILYLRLFRVEFYGTLKTKITMNCI